MLQLEGYKNFRYLRCLRRGLSRFLNENKYIYLYVLLLFAIRSFKLGFTYELLVGWILILSYSEYIKFKSRRNVKKPLVFTYRATRLFILFMGLQVLFGLLLDEHIRDLLLYLIGLNLLLLISPLTLILANTLIYPLELLVQLTYLRSAQNRVKELNHITTVGITGSYGKTSTKHFVAAILSEKFNVLMTPGSYNTLMGVTKVIREKLGKEHEVFVCEMGAHQIGDIRELAKLVRPKVGVITSIGPQHLESFKSIENVIKTKFELVEELPPDGVAILNGDNEYCLSYSDKVANGRRVLFFGYERITPDLYVWAEDIKTTCRGLEFTVKVRDGQEFRCRTSLLGRHNVGNLLAAIAVALVLGMNLKEIERGIKRIAPVPHRLQLINSESGITVIDDSFNSNPVGFREALSCLKEMEGGKKVVVTPGMVELGEIEYEENRKAGLLLAETCDYVILVGKGRSKPILEGLCDAGFPSDKIKVVSNLEEAKRELARILRPGDIVLFENDLPDNYSE